MLLIAPISYIMLTSRLSCGMTGILPMALEDEHYSPQANFNSIYFKMWMYRRMYTSNITTELFHLKIWIYYFATEEIQRYEWADYSEIITKA